MELGTSLALCSGWGKGQKCPQLYVCLLHFILDVSHALPASFPSFLQSPLNSFPRRTVSVIVWITEVETEGFQLDGHDNTVYHRVIKSVDLFFTTCIHTERTVHRIIANTYTTISVDSGHLA